VDVSSNIAAELAPRAILLLRVGRVLHLAERRERELRVDRHQAPGQTQHGIDRLPVQESVLQGEMLDGEDLLQKRAQGDLPQATPDLRGLKDLLQAPDVLPEREDLLTAPSEFAQAHI